MEMLKEVEIKVKGGGFTPENFKKDHLEITVDQKVTPSGPKVAQKSKMENKQLNLDLPWPIGR